jgi:hypothetical protein
MLSRTLMLLTYILVAFGSNTGGSAHNELHHQTFHIKHQAGRISVNIFCYNT